jgi:hypothetical protein
VNWQIRCVPLLLAVGALAGCQDKPAVQAGPPPDPEVHIRAMLATLSPEDQRLAERQYRCPLMPEARLGAMGPPHKIVVNGETVFVCCRNCVRMAEENPDQTAAQVKTLQENRARELKEQASPAATK